MAKRKFSALSTIADLVKPYRLVLAGILVCLVVVSCLNLAMPKILKYVFDSIFPGTGSAAAVEVTVRLARLGRILVLVFLIYAVKNVLFYHAKSAVTVVGERSAFELRQRLISHLHALSVDFYHQNKPGKISARVMQDVETLKEFIQEELAAVVINLLMLVVAAVIMVLNNWFLAILSLAVMPFHVLVYYLFKAPIAAYSKQAKEGMANVSGDLIEQFNGAATVKASATQLLEQQKLRLTMQRSMRAQIVQSRYYNLQKVTADMLVGIGTIVLLSVGGYSVLKGSMTKGGFVEFYAYIGLLYPRLLELVSQSGKFTRTATSVERVSEILQLEPDVAESPNAIPHEILAGKIEFQNVSFAYGSNQVLEDVSFTIEPREHVLLTGPSGAGKTTCVNLIPRFYDPAQGRILIDGIDVRDFTLTSLRRQIGFVFQDGFLFNASIMANIRYAWPQASDEDVIEAARKAYAHDFIEKLPDSYMTLIGEGGVQLSQGEKRRLMIARAILKDPKILILDEPLVSLDLQAREGTMEGLSSLMGNRTVVTISHYPAELPYACKELHISDGGVTRVVRGHVLT
jgi:ABC-type multidrug transport system fused ATPase/permease subunit